MLADDSALVDPRGNEHLLLLYGDEARRDQRVIQFINEGLKRNQLCIHATLDKNEKTLSKMASDIIDYKNNLKNGNLLIPDITYLYEAALREDWKPFDDFAAAISSDAQSRSDKYIRIVGGCAPFLFQNKYLKQSIVLEDWVQRKPFNGSMLCPLRSSLFNEDPFKNYQKVYQRCHDKVLIC